NVAPGAGTEDGAMAIDVIRDMDRLRGEIDDMRRDLRTLTRTVRDFGSEKGQRALDTFERYRRRARKQARRTEKRIERQIEERPIASILTAFCAGFLIAKLLDIGRA